MWKKQSGPRRVNYIWVLAGVYLAYLGGKIIIEMAKGYATSLWWKYLIAVLFIIIGGLLGLREWKIYRHGSKDDALYTNDVPEDFYENIDDNFENEFENELENENSEKTEE